MRSKTVVVVAFVVIFLAAIFSPTFAEQRVKLRGYVTEKLPDGNLKILQDLVRVDSSTRFEVENAGEGKRPTLQDLAVGILVEAEGTWVGKHQFSAQKVSCGWDQFDREIKETALLEQLPSTTASASGGSAPIAVDGEVLVLGEGAKISDLSAAAGSKAGVVHYRGVRRGDGLIEAKQVEIEPPFPADAYEIGHGLKVVRNKDPKTGTEILEFRKGKDVVGRLKLFPVIEVQDYVTTLGNNLLPSALQRSAVPAEFRFYVIEDPAINASALPDGTILVNTGLLGAMENEAQLAFVLSHEITHVVQAHPWRHVHETRNKRILITIAAVAGSGFIGNLGNFFGAIALAAVWNGYGRRLENQADRLGLQNVVDHGYDPRQAPRLSEIIIDHYGDRSTSAIWSNHDSSVLRGSFLTVQIRRRFPGEDFQQKKTDTQAFRDMKEIMGPVKIM